MNLRVIFLGLFAVGCAGATASGGGGVYVAPDASGEQDLSSAQDNGVAAADVADVAAVKDSVAPPDVSGVDAKPDVPTICGALNGPGVAGCCVCGAGKTCDPNGCYAGWYCNTQTCKCQAPPDPTTCGNAPDVGPTDTGISPPDVQPGDTSGVQSIGPTGGTLDNLDFAIVGDTRPPNKDDLQGYPTDIITQIFQDVQAENPPLPFVITTGDYQFSSPSNASSATSQFDLYLTAQSQYTGIAYHTMGNHECTGAVVSNCGLGNTDGLTQTYQIFMKKLMAPLGLTKPWYVLNFQAKDGSWTAKFVVVAANAWSAEQATWLENAMSKPTTYTFVVRHEGVMVTTAPGVTPSAAIIAKYPFTLLLVGHTHTFDYYSADREVITGNGGAPLATGVNYGYTVVRRRADGALVLQALDYQTKAPTKTFAVKADGTPTK